MMSEPEVLTEVPASLKLLVRIIMRCFYGDEHAVVMDKLIHHPCIKEDDLLELLRFERKQLRAIITTLRNEKFVRARMRVETDTDSARSTRHNYYFISYSVFVNVVKYKLHHIRRKIETDERDATNRASFSCPDCMKTFTDLEVDQLVDMMTGCLRCTYCQSELIEEASNNSAGQNDTRSLMAKFNDHFEPIYALLRKVEDIRLSAEILEPEPTDYKPTRSSGNQPSDSRGSLWSGELAKNTSGFGYSEKHVTIALDSAGGTASKADVKPVKEVPLWLSHSTVDTSDYSERQLQSVQAAGSTESSRDGGVSLADKDDIMRTLLSHEKSASSSAAAAVGGGASTQSSSSDSDADDELNTNNYSGAVGDVEPMDSEDEASDAEMTSMMVTVGSQSIPFSEVTEALIARMTTAEKDEYVRVGQQLYDQFNH